MKAPRISMPVTHGSHYGGAPLVPRSTQMRERWDRGAWEPPHESMSTLAFDHSEKSGRKPPCPADQDRDLDDVTYEGDDLT